MFRKRIVSTMAVLVVVSVAVRASDIDNSDQRDYELHIRSGSGSVKNYTLYHGSTLSGVCSSPCEIEVGGVGTVRLDGKNSAVIKDGKVFVK